MNPLWALVPFIFTLGFCAIVPAANKLLAYKYREINQSWNQHLQEYENHYLFTHRKPDPSGERVERGLWQWAKRQQQQVKAGNLSYEQVLALRMVDIVPNPPYLEKDPVASLPRNKDIEARYATKDTRIKRIACGVVPSAAAAMLIFGNASALSWACALGATFLMELVFLCDVSARIIPYQLCIAFAAIAAVFSFEHGGLEGLFTSCLCAFGLFLCLLTVNKLMALTSGAAAIGAGDMRLIPLLCIFSGLSGALAGFAVASIVMAAIAIFTLVFKGGTRKSFIPYAPGLASWCAIGLIVQIFGTQGIGLF